VSNRPAGCWQHVSVLMLGAISAVLSADADRAAGAVDADDRNQHLFCGE
jgi:hypothetical protein